MVLRSRLIRTKHKSFRRCAAWNFFTREYAYTPGRGVANGKIQFENPSPKLWAQKSETEMQKIHVVLNRDSVHKGYPKISRSNICQDPGFSKDHSPMLIVLNFIKDHRPWYHLACSKLPRTTYAPHINTTCMQYLTCIEIRAVLIFAQL